MYVLLPADVGAQRSQDGGALSFDGFSSASIVVRDSDFEKSTAVGSGGAISAFSVTDSTFFVENSSFRNSNAVQVDVLYVLQCSDVF